MHVWALYAFWCVQGTHYQFSLLYIGDGGSGGGCGGDGVQGISSMHINSKHCAMPTKCAYYGHSVGISTFMSPSV